MSCMAECLGSSDYFRLQPLHLNLWADNREGNRVHRKVFVCKWLSWTDRRADVKDRMKFQTVMPRQSDDTLRRP